MYAFLCITEYMLIDMQIALKFKSLDASAVLLILLIGPINLKGAFFLNRMIFLKFERCLNIYALLLYVRTKCMLKSK